MRILHINCNYIGTNLHQLMIEKLDKMGIENEVFVPTYDKSISVIKTNKNVYVSECFSKWDRLVFDYKQYKIIRAVEEHYDIAKFDLIHAYTLFTDGNVARVLSEKYGVPFVVAIRNTDVNDFLKKMVFLRRRGMYTMLAAKKVFFLSNAYCDTVFENYVSEKFKNTISKKVEIIPNGIDNFWFENMFLERDYNDIYKHIDKKKINIVYAGGIDKNKNIIMTCNAIDVLKSAGWVVEFTVVGKIKDQSVFKKIKSKIHYIPMQPKEKLINIYRKADIFVMPSITESFGLVYVEAMSQGLPVIYTKGQGFDGQFPNGYIGYCCNSNDASALAKMIIKIIENYNKLSKNCYVGCKKFNWNDITEKYLKIYRNCVYEK